MNASARTMEHPAGAKTVETPAVFTVAEIDASCRAPLVLLFVSSAIWLLIATFLGLLGSIKFHPPGFLAGSAWLTLGRIRPAGMNALVYGFGIQAFLGILTWIICRLGRIPLLGQQAVVAGAAMWNAAVTLAVLGILVGWSTGFEWLEAPRLVPPLQFAGFSTIAICTLVTFHFRRNPDLYVSHWFLLGALFWFVWVYSASALLLVYFPVRGVMQAVVDSWYVGNVSQLWFGAAGLGIVFYFIPKLLDRPLQTSTMAAFAFWMLALFAPWTGLVRLIGGPIPAWMLSASILGSVMLITSVIAIAAVIRGTLAGDRSRTVDPIALKFITFGAWAYVIVSSVNILMSFPLVARVTHLTWVDAGTNLFGLYGFVAMVAFGGMHHIVPRLTGIGWPSAKLVNVHMKCSIIGALVVYLALLVGGVIQGFKMNLATADFITLGKLNAAFVGISTIGLLILLVGQAAFLKNLLTLLHIWGAPARKAIAEGVREVIR